MKNSKVYFIVLMIGVFFLSTSAIFVKVIEAPVSVIAFYRLLISGIIITPIVLSRASLRNEIIKLSKKQLILGGISGVLLAAHYVLWFESLNYTSVASSTVIVTLQPIFAVGFGYFFFNERINRIGMVGILFSILGSCVIGWQDFQSDSLALYGDLLALLAAVFMTAYLFIGQSLRKNMSIFPYALVGYFSSSLVLCIYGLFLKTDFINYPPKTWILLISMAILSTIFGQMLINWVLKWLSATTVSVAILSEVIWAILLSIIVLNEQITLRQIEGILVIIVGLLMYSYREKLVSVMRSYYAKEEC